MDELWQRFWQELVARPRGPMALRFYLQPLMAAIFAVRDGLRDAKMRRPAYFWAVLTNASDRGTLIREGWKSIGTIFIIAVILDTVYQILVLRGLRPVETLFVAFVLAIVPYLIVRGPVNRLARAAKDRGPGSRRAA
jgi:hypothetical protein